MNKLSKELSAPGSRLVATCLTAQSPRRAGDALVFLGEYGWTGVQTEIDELSKVCSREIADKTYIVYFVLVVEYSTANK